MKPNDVLKLLTPEKEKDPWTSPSIDIYNGYNSMLCRNYKKDCVVAYLNLYDLFYFMIVKGTSGDRSYKIARICSSNYRGMTAQQIDEKEAISQIESGIGKSEIVDRIEFEKLKNKVLLESL